MYKKGDIFLYIVIVGGLVIVVSELLQSYPSFLVIGVGGLLPIAAAILRMYYDRKNNKR